jgi:hypothetical protein
MVSPNPLTNMKNETITSGTIKGGRQLIVNYLNQSFNLADQELELDYVVPFANRTIVCTNAG